MLRWYLRGIEGAAAIIALVFGFAAIVGVLAYNQRLRTGRVCPSCNRVVPQLDSECRHCGYDFRIG